MLGSKVIEQQEQIATLYSVFCSQIRAGWIRERFLKDDENVNGSGKGQVSLSAPRRLFLRMKSARSISANSSVVQWLGIGFRVTRVRKGDTDGRENRGRDTALHRVLGILGSLSRDWDKIHEASSALDFKAVRDLSRPTTNPGALALL